MHGINAMSRRTGDELLRSLVAAFLLLCLGAPLSAAALPLEMLALPQSVDEDSELALTTSTSPEFESNSIEALLPNLMPLYAGTNFNEYAGSFKNGNVAARQDWSVANKQWLQAMLPTMLQVRRKANEDEVQLYDRLREREERMRLAPRAGRPAVEENDADRGPQLGVRLTDILLRYAGRDGGSIAPHLTSGESRDANPFEDENGGGGFVTILLLAEVDTVAAEELDRTASEHEKLIATTLETSEAVARQLAQFDTKFKNLMGSGPLNSSVSQKGTMRSLITSGRSGSSGKSQANGPSNVSDGRSIRLTSFLVSLGVSIITSPLTYLIAMPILFGWLLIRVARSRHA